MDYGFGKYNKDKKTPAQEYLDWQKDPTDESYARLVKTLKPTINTALTVLLPLLG